jgi:hypothetical protein
VYLIDVRYSLFRPEVYWWRMLLTLRKFSEVAVALMFSSSPLFQAWYVTRACLRETERDMETGAG